MLRNSKNQSLNKSKLSKLIFRSDFMTETIRTRPRDKDEFEAIARIVEMRIKKGVKIVKGKIKEIKVW